MSLNGPTRPFPPKSQVETKPDKCHQIGAGLLQLINPSPPQQLPALGVALTFHLKLVYLKPMNATFSPIESEFATNEEAEAYDRWFRNKVRTAINDPRPPIPHDQVMAETRALLARKKSATTSQS